MQFDMDMTDYIFRQYLFLIKPVMMNYGPHWQT